MRNLITLIFATMLSVSSLNSQTTQKQISNNNKFTFEMFNYSNVNSENLFLSPFSVSTALAMTYEGAKGKTRSEMSEVLHFPDNSESFNKSFSEIISKTQSSQKSDNYIFNIANSLWAQKDFNFFNAYFNTIKNYYHAPLTLVDYKNSEEREKIRKGINKWVENKTNDKIKDLISEGDIDNETKMVLVNAVYFLAEWKKEFNKKMTKSDIFYSVSGKVNKDFMRTSANMKYAKSANSQMLEIPYKNNKASMVIIMPNENVNFSEFKKNFNSIKYDELYKSAEYKSVNLFLPKFKIEFKKDLAADLARAGMKRAFSNKADFRGMTCKKEIRIDKIIHQTFIDVDESGTEAAAATAVIMKRITSIAPSKKIDFRANKAFIFLIKDNSTGSILFIGQLVK